MHKISQSNKYQDRVPVSYTSTTYHRAVDDVTVVIAVCGWSGDFGEGRSVNHHGHRQEEVCVAL